MLVKTIGLANQRNTITPFITQLKLREGFYQTLCIPRRSSLGLQIEEVLYYLLSSSDHYGRSLHQNLCYPCFQNLLIEKYRIIRYQRFRRNSKHCHSCHIHPYVKYNHELLHQVLEVHDGIKPVQPDY